jgi:hypothetical protein
VVNSIPPGKLSPFSSFVQPLLSDALTPHLLYRCLWRYNLYTILYHHYYWDQNMDGQQGGLFR